MKTSSTQFLWPQTKKNQEEKIWKYQGFLETYPTKKLYWPWVSTPLGPRFLQKSGGFPVVTKPCQSVKEVQKGMSSLHIMEVRGARSGWLYGPPSRNQAYILVRAILKAKKIPPPELRWASGTNFCARWSEWASTERLRFSAVAGTSWQLFHSTPSIFMCKWCQVQFAPGLSKFPLPRSASRYWG